MSAELSARSQARSRASIEFWDRLDWDNIRFNFQPRLPAIVAIPKLQPCIYRKFADLSATTMDLGKTIKVLRTAAGISQKDLARQLDISPSYLSLIESNDREPSISLLRQISRAFDAPIGVFFFQNDEQEDSLTPSQREERHHVQEWMGQILNRMLALQKKGPAKAYSSQVAADTQGDLVSE